MLILIAILLSIDAFSVGLSYGMREINISSTSKIIISSISALITFIAILTGTKIAMLFSSLITKLIGILVLFSMGIYLIIQSIISQEKNHDQEIIQEINLRETFLLGITLSLDSIGSGIGVSILGFNNLLLPVITACCQYIFLFFGIKLGTKLSSSKLNTNIILFISGLILIFIALQKFF